MCAHGDTVPLTVIVPAVDSYERADIVKVKPIDRCIAPIVEALNEAWIFTRSACCGHGKEDGSIILHDGRVLHVEQPEWTTCMSCGMYGGHMSDCSDPPLVARPQDGTS